MCFWASYGLLAAVGSWTPESPQESPGSFLILGDAHMLNDDTFLCTRFHEEEWHIIATYNLQIITACIYVQTGGDDDIPLLWEALSHASHWFSHWSVRMLKRHTSTSTVVQFTVPVAMSSRARSVACISNSRNYYLWMGSKLRRLLQSIGFNGFYCVAFRIWPETHSCVARVQTLGCPWEAKLSQLEAWFVGPWWSNQTRYSKKHYSKKILPLACSMLLCDFGCWV